MASEAGLQEGFASSRDAYRFQLGSMEMDDCWMARAFFSSLIISSGGDAGG